MEPLPSTVEFESPHDHPRKTEHVDDDTTITTVPNTAAESSFGGNYSTSDCHLESNSALRSKQALSGVQFPNLVSIEIPETGPLTPEISGDECSRGTGKAQQSPSPFKHVGCKDIPLSFDDLLKEVETSRKDAVLSQLDLQQAERRIAILESALEGPGRLGEPKALFTESLQRTLPVATETDFSHVLQAENQVLLRQVKESKGRVEELESSLNQLAESSGAKEMDMVQKLTDYKQKTHVARVELDRAKQLMQTLQSDLQGVREADETNEEEICEAKARVEALEKLLHESWHDKTKGRDEPSRRSKRLLEGFLGEHTKVKQMERENSRLWNECHSLTEQSAHEQEENSMLRLKIIDLAAEKTNLEMRLEQQLQRQVEANDVLRAQMDKTKSEIKKREEEDQRIRKEYKSLLEAEEKNSRLLRHDQLSAKKDVKTLELEYQELLKKHAEANEKIFALQATVENLQDTNEQLAQEKDMAVQKWVKSRSLVESLERDLKELRTSYETSTSVWNTKLKRLRDRSSIDKVAIQELEDYVQRMECKIDELTRASSEYRHERDQKEIIIDSFILYA